MDLDDFGGSQVVQGEGLAPAAALFLVRACKGVVSRVYFAACTTRSPATEEAYSRRRAPLGVTLSTERLHEGI